MMDFLSVFVYITTMSAFLLGKPFSIVLDLCDIWPIHFEKEFFSYRSFTVLFSIFTHYYNHA